MPRFLVPLAAAALLAVPAASPAAALAAPAAAQEPERAGALVLVLPEPEARALGLRRPVAYGLGVYPSDRAAATFLEALAAGDELEGTGLVAAARAAGLEVRAGVAARAADLPGAVLARAVEEEPRTVPMALAADVSVLVLRFADDAEAVLRLDDRPAFVVAPHGRTPVLVGLFGVPESGLLAGGTPRRAGLLTPGDLSRTILDAAGVATEEALLVFEPSTEPLAFLDDLATRLERDTRWPTPLTIATTFIGIALVAVAALALLVGLRRLARGAALAAAFLPAGYLGAMFLGTEAWEPRAAVVALACAAGLALFAAPVRSTAGGAVGAAAVAVVVLTILAELSPDGEIARTVWPNPLEIWRFHGMTNFLAAFLIGGFLAAATLLAWPAVGVVAAALVLGPIIAGPTLGANFVAVAILAIGVTTLVLARAAGRPRLFHLPFAGVAGVAALTLAMLADAGAQVSHGGRAAGSIRDGGLSALWDIVTRRARLNYEDIVTVGWIGFVGLALAAVVLASLFWWAVRSRHPDAGVRAGVGAISIASLVTIAAEDSGFFMGSILGLFAWIVFAAGRAAPAGEPASDVRPAPDQDLS